MGILSGLEKFGFASADKISLFEDEAAKNAEAGKGGAAKEEVKTEDFFLLDKEITCIVCDKKFKTKMVKSGKAKRMEPDKDLRPRFEIIDVLKYQVTACPHCGYSAMDNQFTTIMPAQRKLVRENVCAQFRADLSHQNDVTYSYETAIERYQLALLNAVVKKGKASEKAYICLKTAWLYRGYAEELAAKEKKDEEKIKQCKAAEEEFYKEAYEGFVKAMSSESYPMCGMGEDTVDYLLANMACHFKDYAQATKLVAGILQATSASRKMKEMARDLKDEIAAAYKADHAQK